MQRATPNGLGLKLMSIYSDDVVYALCHPIDDALIDRSQSAIFSVADASPKSVRIFDTEITSIEVYKGSLFCVDRLQKVYEYADDSWTDHDNNSTVPYRINTLRAADGDLFGLGSDGLVFSWTGSEWSARTSEKEDAYLFALVDWVGRGLIVTGNDGLVALLGDGGLEQIDIPTGVALTDALVLADKRLLVIGRRATAVILDDDEATVADSGDRKLSFLNAVLWQDRVLIAANSEIAELKGNRVETFQEIRTGRLYNNGNRLWRQTDGSCWFTDDGIDWTEVVLEVDL